MAEFSPSLEKSQDVTDRYKILGEIARGGMGVVYRVKDLDMDRVLAMKVLSHVEKAKTSDAQSDYFARFIEEVQVTAQLDHPAIVPVHDVGFDEDGTPFYTMRFVKGRHLGDIIALSQNGEDGWTLSRLIEVLVKVCQALAHAHGKGVLHRDLKPANIMVGDLGEVYVMDWGLARMLGREDRRDLRLGLAEGDGLETINALVEADARASIDQPLMTMDGAVVGTPAYMPPEQADGKVAEVDHLSDVYALGSILYHMLAGHPPYMPTDTKTTAVEVLTELRSRPPARILQRDLRLPAELLAVCDKAMARERSARYPSAIALAEDLQAYLEGRVVRAHRTGARVELSKWIQRNKMAAAVAALLAICVIGFLILQGYSNQRLNTTNAQLSDTLALANDETQRANEQAAQADEARQETSFTVSDMQANNGANAAQNGEHNLATLWFAKAAQSAAGDPTRVDANRRRTAAWRQEQLTAVRAFAPKEGDFVESMDWNPSHPALLLYLSSGRFHVLDIRDSAEVWLPELDSITCACWSPDGSQLLTCVDSRISLLAYPSGEEIASLDNTFAWSASWHPGGRKILLGVQLWDLDLGTTTEVSALTDVRNIAFDAAGETILIQGTRTTEIRSASAPFLLLHPAHPSSTNTAASFLGNGDQYTTVLDTGAVVLRETLSGQPAHEYAGSADHGKFWSSSSGRYFIKKGDKLVDHQHKDFIESISSESSWQSAAFDEQNERLAIGGSEQIIELWSLAERRLIQQVGSPYSRIHSLAFSPDGEYLAAGEEELVRVWRTRVPSTSYALEAAGDSVAVSSDGKLLAPGGSAHGINTVRHTSVYNIANGNPITPKMDPGGKIMAAVFHPANEWLALSVSTTEDRSQVAFLDTSRGSENIAIGSNGGGSGNVQLWHPSNGQRIGDPFPMPSEPRGIDAHPSGQFLAVSCASGETVEIDVASRTSRILFTEPGPLNGPAYPKNNGRCSYSADGRLVARWGVWRGAPIWERDRAEFLVPPNSIHVETHDLSFGDDVMVSATASFGKSTIHFTDMITGKAIMEPQPYAVDSVVSQLDSTGRQLLLGGGKGAQVWDWRNRQPLGPSLPHSGAVFSGTFLPENRGVVTGGNEPLLRFWDYLTGLPTRPTISVGSDISHDSIIQLEITSDGRFLTASGFGLLYVVDLDTAFPEPELSVDVALRLAEIDASAEILKSGGVNRLTASTWMEKWRAFRADYPDFTGHQLKSAEAVGRRNVSERRNGATLLIK